MRALRYLTLLASTAYLCGARPVVTKVEPPNWWASHSLNPDRLLIHGSGLQGATVTATRGLRTSRASVNDAGTYVFVDVTIPRGAAPGEYPLQIRTEDGIANAPFRLDGFSRKS